MTNILVARTAWLTLGLCLCACSSEDEGSGTTEVTRELKSALARQSPAPGAEVATVEDLSEFAGTFYSGLEKPGGNLVYSPYSIAVASAMLSAGAASSTLTQLQAALHFSTIGSSLHAGQNALAQTLATRNREGSAEANAQVLRVSNDFWMLPALAPQPAFLDTLAEYYGAGVHLAPFDSNPEGCREDINSKVSSDTGRLIPELLPQDSIDSGVVFVLTNALYFKSRWQSQFPTTSTQPGPFTTLSGGTVQTDLMRQQTEAEYLQGDGFLAVELPYDGAELSMLFVVPEAGSLDRFAQSLDAARLDAILKGLQPTYVDLSLPKFTVTGDLPLADQLKAAGMVDAFDPGRADFSPLAPDLYISAAFHQAKLILDETGTEAAAATAFVGRVTSVPPAPIRVVIDRPFLFLLRDITGAVLFMGQLANPG
ncbi:MAG: hypothetical protein RL685_6203 [Pseudomonadota bacterium]|jgi:serpin B